MAKDVISLDSVCSAAGSGGRGVHCVLTSSPSRLSRGAETKAKLSVRSFLGFASEERIIVSLLLVSDAAPAN